MSGGRIRSIKPEILDDEKSSALSDAAWRLWVSSWVLADDQGNLRAGHRFLAANVWQDTTRDVGPALLELVEVRLFEPYSFEGQRYVHIHAWAKHQRIDNAAKPRIPTQNQDDGTWLRELTEELAELRGGIRDAKPSLSGEESSPLRARAQTRSLAAKTPTPTPTPNMEQTMSNGPSLPLLDVGVVDSGESTSARSVLEVFQYWATKRSQLTGGAMKTLKPTADRKRRIQARLREGYSVADLCKAIDGMFATEWNITKGFTDVELACRDAAHVDRFMAGGAGAAEDPDDFFRAPEADPKVVASAPAAPAAAHDDLFAQADKRVFGGQP